MKSGPELSIYADRYPFWITLLDLLGDVLDSHGVCAAVAKSLSDFLSARVIVVLRDPSRDRLNVWLSEPNADTFQTQWLKSNDLLNFLIDEGVPVVLERSEHSSVNLRQSDLWFNGSEKIIAAPLPFPANREKFDQYGAIFVHDPMNGVVLELEHLGFIASQVSVYLDRALLRQKTDRQEVEFGLVSDIGNSITSSLNLDDIASSVADSIRGSLGVECISIGLLEQSGERLEFIQSIMDSRFQKLQRVQLRIGEGIAGWVAKNDTHAIVNDVSNDDRFYAEFDAQTGFTTRSILCVPLRMENEVIGVIEAINKTQGSFDNLDLRLLKSITGPLAIAIQNARLHNSVITEKRRVETIFASMSEGLLTANHERKITATNDALERLIERDVQDLMGSELIDIFKTRQPGFTEFIEVVRKNGNQFQQLICDIEKPDGGFVPVIISGSIIKHKPDGGDELVFVFSDLTEIREIERMRDDFFNNIVHELHTPLATILMYARLLIKGRAEGNKVKENRFLKTIEQESNRLQIMVRQMLHLAKLQAAEMHKIEDSSLLNPVFDQLIPPLADRATSKGLDFEVTAQADLPHIQGDEDTLYMIFKNLIENAIKFTPKGKVSVRALLEDEWVVVRIEDEGIGIPPQGIPNLFSRFYRAQTAVEQGIAGTGLGLYMVKEGLDYCGGTIEVYSETGIGTTFIVRVPVAQ